MLSHTLSVCLSSDFNVYCVLEVSGVGSDFNNVNLASDFSVCIYCILAVSDRGRDFSDVTLTITYDVSMHFVQQYQAHVVTLGMLTLPVTFFCLYALYPGSIRHGKGIY